MNQNDKNIIIDAEYAREQARIHRPILWSALAVAVMVVVLCIAALQGCSDDDDDDSKTDDKAAEISQCKQMADAFQKCIGWDSMATTLKEAKAECEKADFDNYDRCMFDCEALSADCEVLTTCFDEC